MSFEGNKLFHDGHGVAAVGHKIVVDKINEITFGKAPNFLDFVNNLVDRPMPELAAVDLGDLTEAAVKRAAAGGLGGNVHQLVFFQIQQVITGHRQVLEVGQVSGPDIWAGVVRPDNLGEVGARTASASPRTRESACS